MSTTQHSSQQIADKSEHVPGETCPRCHTTQLWGESSWCPNCSYYPVVDGSATDGRSWADALPDMPQDEAESDLSPLESIPLWFWGMIAGVIAITTCSVAVRMSFPDEDSPRGIIALIQIAVGMISMITAHGIASKFALQNDRRLNVNDILLSWFNVWQPTISRLPSTCRRVLAVVWGGFAVLTAVTIIGGIDYSAPFRVHKKPDLRPQGQIRENASAAQGDDDTAAMEEALAELQSPDPTTADPKDGVNEDHTFTMSCFIYGVETDQTGVPQAFLFAANTKGKEQHVARLKREDLPPTDFRTIVVQLYVAAQSEPEIETERKAIWVKPIVSCRLAFTGFSETGELKQPEFEAILVQQKGRLDVHDSQNRTPYQRRKMIEHRE